MRRHPAVRRWPPAARNFCGTLERAEGGGWQIVWSDEPKAKPGQKISKKRAAAPLQALGFTLDELREARLAPIVDFKGRRAKTREGSFDISGADASD